MIHVAFLANSNKSLKMFIHLSYKAQLALLIANNAHIAVLSKCFNYANMILSESTIELPEHTKINDHLLDLIEGQQPSYGLIYSLKLVELETLKTYIITNLVNSFIQPSKSPVKAPIFLFKSQMVVSGCILITKFLLI